MRRPLAFVVVAAALAGCAPSAEMAARAGPSAPGEARQCFDPARIVNFTRGETSTLYVRALGGEVFVLTGAGCPDIGSGPTIAVTPALGFGSRICVGDDADVVSPSTTFGPLRCRARVTRALTEAEVEALPSRYRP